MPSAPNPYAPTTQSRPGRAAEWTTYTGDDDWLKLIQGDDVPAPSIDLGCRGSRRWAAVWSGPLRLSLLPQMLENLEDACCLADRLGESDLADSTRSKLLAESRQWSRLFGLDVDSARRFKIKPAELAQIVGSAADEDREVAEPPRHRVKKPKRVQY